MISERRKCIESQGEGCFCNCWGATMYVLGIWDSYWWVQREEMVPELEKLPVIAESELRPGDIVVWRSHWLEHTAIYVGDGKVWHKPGGWRAAIDRIEDITEDNGYYYGQVSEYRRVA